MKTDSFRTPFPKSVSVHQAPYLRSHRDPNPPLPVTMTTLSEQLTSGIHDAIDASRWRLRGLYKSLICHDERPAYAPSLESCMGLTTISGITNMDKARRSAGDRGSLNLFRGSFKCFGTSASELIFYGPLSHSFFSDGRKFRIFQDLFRFGRFP